MYHELELSLMGLFIINAAIFLFYKISDYISPSKPGPTLIKVHRCVNVVWLNAGFLLYRAAEPLSFGRYAAVIALGVVFYMIGRIESIAIADAKSEDNSA